MLDAEVGTSNLGEEANSQVVDTGTDSSNSGPVETINPAWNDLLGVLPDPFKPLVTPHLKKWDQNFSSVQAKYKPYDTFIEQGINPEDLANAHQIYRVLNDNPRAIYDRMVETFGEEWGINRSTPPVAQAQGQNSVAEEETFDFGNTHPGLENDPKYQELAANQKILVEYFYGQQQAQLQAEEDAKLEAEVAGLKAKYGDFPEDVVFSLALNGKMTLEQAINRVMQLSGGGQQQPSSNIPQIMPTNGGIPSNAIDVTSLSPKDTRGLALSFINSSKGQ